MFVLTACGGGEGDSADSSITDSNKVTLHGTVFDREPGGATVEVLSSAGDRLGETEAGDDGSYRVDVSEAGLKNGYSVLAKVKGPADKGHDHELMASYNESHDRDRVNLTPITTLLVTLAENNTPSGGLLADHQDALDLLADIGMVSKVDWFDLEPSLSNPQHIQAQLRMSGLTGWVQSLARDLQDGELSPRHMAAFPEAHGGVFGIELQGPATAGVEWAQDIPVVSLHPRTDYMYDLRSAPPGMTLHNGDFLTFDTNAVQAGQDYDFTVRITHPETGFYRDVTESVEVRPVKVLVRDIIGPAGGEISVPDSEVRIVVPEAAFNEDIELSIVRTSNQDGTFGYSVRMDPPEPDLNLLPILQVPEPTTTGDSESRTQSLSTEAAEPAELRLLQKGDSDRLSPGWREVDTYGHESVRYANFFRIFKRRSVDPVNRLPADIYVDEAVGWTEIFSTQRIAAIGNEIEQKSASRLTTRCNDGPNACAGRTPVIFIHGYQRHGGPGGLGDELGGHVDYWAEFPRLLDNAGYAVFIFQWRTSARFQDVAGDLGEAIRVARQVVNSDNDPHIIAHSFGGLVARTFLQGLQHAPSVETASPNDVASLITVGTPHSGIANNSATVDFPDLNLSQVLPQGSSSISGRVLQLCRQISCYQAGLASDAIFDINSRKEDYGVLDRAGEIPALLAITSESLNTNMLALHGLSVTDMSGTYGQTDGLIHWQGQRVHPALSCKTATECDNFSIGASPQSTSSLFRNARIEERVLGVGGARGFDVKPGAPYNNIAPTMEHRIPVGPDPSSYFHSDLVSLLGGQHHQIAVEGFSIEEDNKAGRVRHLYYRDHHTYLEVERWLNGGYRSDWFEQVDGQLKTGKKAVDLSWNDEAENTIVDVLISPKGQGCHFRDVGGESCPSSRRLENFEGGRVTLEGGEEYQIDFVHREIGMTSASLSTLYGGSRVAAPVGEDSAALAVSVRSGRSMIEIDWKELGAVRYNLCRSNEEIEVFDNCLALDGGAYFSDIGEPPFEMDDLQLEKSYHFVVEAEFIDGLLLSEEVIKKLHENVIFVTDEDGAWDIWKSSLDDSNIANLTSDPANDRLPAVSPHLDEIAFVSDRGGPNDVYVMDIEGSNVRQLTSEDADDGFPVWSPDGKRIAFISERGSGGAAFDIYVMGASGAERNAVTASDGDDTQPHWSPDGSQLVFVSDRDGSEDVFIMNADGSGEANLTRSASEDTIPFFSPTGSQITFVSDRDGAFDLWVMDAEGGNERKLTSELDDEVGWYSWSPSGELIAFDSRASGVYEIYIVNPDGTGLKQLTDDSASNRFASWTWYGSKIAYVSNVEGTYQINIVDPKSLENVKVFGGSTDNVHLAAASPVYEEGGGCFIATAAYGSYLDTHVVELRRFRDEHLLRYSLGEVIVEWYYLWSPKFAEVIRENELLRSVVRLAITPIVVGVRYPLESLIGIILAIICMVRVARIGGHKVFAAGMDK